MNKTIFVVIECFDYEGSNPLRAFSNESDAEEFVDALKQYDQKRPECPDINDSDRKWERFNNAWGKWQASHPAGPDSVGANGYAAIEIPLDRLPGL